MNKIKNTIIVSLVFIFCIMLSAFAADIAQVSNKKVVSELKTSNSIIHLDAHDQVLVHGQVLEALAFAHRSYGFVSWTMTSIRRNLHKIPVFDYMKGLEHFVDRSILMANMAIRLSKDNSSLSEVKTYLEDMKKVIKYSIEANTKSETKPNSKIEEAGKIYKQIGKALPKLYLEFKKILESNKDISKGSK